MEEREVIVLLFTLAALIFLVARRKEFLAQSGRALQLGAVAALAVGMVLTTIENLFPASSHDVVNVLEHGCFLVHTVLLALYAFKHVRPAREQP